MFLLYRNQGERRYGLKPLAAHPRKAWGFQFFLEGSCSMVLKENEVTTEDRITGPLLVVTGPACVHGWYGKPSDYCKVMVFHFDEADYSLRSILGQTGHRAVRISQADFPALQALYSRCDEVRKTLGHPPPEAKKRAGLLAPLIYGVVATELTLYFLRHLPRAGLSPAPDFGESKVSQALAWYEANLASGPNIADVAHAVHLSSTHPRRLFHKFRDMSPQAALTRVQFERAKWLMRDLGMPLERVSESSGFGSASAFSRAFKMEYGVSPKVYRASLQKKL